MQGLSRRKIIFSAGRKITPYPTEDLGSFERPKAARDFLLHFGHAEIVFTLIVGEWHERVAQESQGFDFEFAKTLQEIACFGPGNASTFSGVSLGIEWGTFTLALGQDLAIRATESVGGGGTQASPGLKGRGVHFPQERLHLLGPSLSVLLPGTFEFAQVMGVAESVLAGELKVRVRG